ncbi:MAG: glycosyltransferase family 87 protein [Bacteroidota bacterium]
MSKLIQKLSDFWENIVEDQHTESKTRKILGVILVLVIIFLWANAGIRANRGHGSQLDDFVYFSKDLIYDDVNVYKEYAYDRLTIGKYPPFFGLVYAPLVPLPHWLGALVWFALSFWIVLQSSKALGKMSNLISNRENQLNSISLWALPLLMTISVVITNLETSQVNIAIFGLIALGLYYFAEQKIKHAGFLLGVATAIKLTPGLFVVYFALKRKWNIVLWAAIGGLVSWGIILPIALGFDRYLDIMQSWLGILFGFVETGALAENDQGFTNTNQSLESFFYRYFTHVDTLRGSKTLYVNVMDLPKEAIAGAMRYIKIGILLLFLYLFRRPIKANDPRIPLEVGLIAIGTLFISPISWINHYVYMLLPFSGIVYYLRTNEKSPFNRQMTILTVISALLVVISPKIAQAFSLPFLGGVIGFYVCVRILLKMNKDMKEA